MLDPTAAIDAINQQLGTVGIDVYEAQVPDDRLNPTADGVMLPFYVTRFGGPVRAARGRNITTVRHHVNVMFLTVACMAADPEALKWIYGQAINVLTGYVPPDSGELILEGGLSYSEGSSTVRPTRYLKDISYTFRTNLTLSD
jgi:hypothetical protein